MAPAIVQPSDKAIARAAQLLRDGELVVFPTETVYGLGGDATSEAAVARIFAAKGRPRFNPLIVHVPGLAEAEAFAVFDERARDAARRFWPGPLTLVLPRRSDSGLSLLAGAGLDTVALRAPAHPVARQLLRAADKPIAAPSANRSGRVSPTMAAHVAAEFFLTTADPHPPIAGAMGPPLSRDAGEGKRGAAATPSRSPGEGSQRVAAPPLSRTAGEGARGRRPRAGEGAGPTLILDGGACPVGLESTILDLTSPVPVLLRPGGVSLEELMAVFGEIAVASAGDQTLRAPGSLPSHYAPSLKLRLDAREARPGEALLAFGPEAPPPGFAELLWLSRSGDPTEAAANLFASLRQLDRPEFTGIAVMPIPEHGLGRAINDRLRRAAAPRPGNGGGRTDAGG